MLRSSSHIFNNTLTKGSSFAPKCNIKLTKLQATKEIAHTILCSEKFEPNEELIKD